MDTRKRIEVADIDNITMVSFTDTKIFDEQIIHILGKQLFDVVDLGRRKIILNFGNVEYLSCAMMGKLITLQKKN